MGAIFENESQGAVETGMSTYTAGFKTRMVQRMTGRESISATALANEVGVSQNTLSRWLRQASGPTVAAMKQDRIASSKGSARLTAEEKLKLLLRAAALSDEELGEFLRKEGLHAAQLEEWRAAATGALKGLHNKRSERTSESRKIQELERELRRKDKALAEVSALLILKKKVQEIWGDEDDATGTRKGT